ncbi:hypothetical protein [Echinicola salinicaeni]|uniref:hypothetical protein n=1 Tax=Echinicola salinicaeni TaxID=2762757 RepID=UPI001644300E|nr:hypothetical protein [Echinicola salinicaeni]
MDCSSVYSKIISFLNRGFPYLLIWILSFSACKESSKPAEESVEAIEEVLEVPEEKVDEQVSEGINEEKGTGGDLEYVIQPEIIEGVGDNGELIGVPMPVIVEDGDSIVMPQTPLEDFKAVLEVEKEIKLHQNASMIVWIGDKSTEYVTDTGSATDMEVFPARIGQYAKVKPIAPDFEIVPSETGCIKIDPSGSKVQFTLKAIEEGTFEVSAEIQLYDNPNCEGTPVPKTTEHLSVRVEVDKDYRWKSRFNKLGEIFWDKFFSFWGALVALILGFLIYIVRKFLKKNTGYEGRE